MGALKSKITLFICIDLCILNFLGCREDIYNPNSSVGNKNEPVTQNHFDMYSFAIDADNFNFNVVEYTRLTDTENFLNFSIDNYQSGYVDLFISDSTFDVLYNNRLIKNNIEVYDTLTGYVPEKIVINFHNFSGNLKVAVYGNY